MFSVDQPTADAIRRVLLEEGELSAVAEVRRHFAALTSNAAALRCAQIIAGWQPMASPQKDHVRRRRAP
jgi:hypothetical protein